jgi:hypothetical protein
MPGPLKKPQQFSRGKRVPKQSLGRRLPGQSPAEDDLGLDVQIKILDRPSSTIIERELIQIGSIGAGRYLEVGTDGIKIYSGGKLKIFLDVDGDVFVGEDLSDPSKTYFTIFANNQTYNSEGVSAGDMLIGDNSASKANIYWDKSAGKLYFRGGQSAAAYVNTNGAIVAGGGDVTLDTAGISLAGGSGNTNLVKFKDSTDLIAFLRAKMDGSVNNTDLIAQGKNSSNHESILSLRAITDDGLAHAGAASVDLILDTSQDDILAYATTIYGFKVLRFMGMTTTQRNALTAINGMIIYNTTTSKFQGRAGGAWVDLH